MSLGLVGRKVGMTRIFTDEGDSLPVTVLDVSDNRVTQIKNTDSDGYVAVQVAFGKRRASRVTKALAGHYAKAGVEAGRVRLARSAYAKATSDSPRQDSGLPAEALAKAGGRPQDRTVDLLLVRQAL